MLDFLAYLEYERGLSRNTLEAYRSDLLQLGDYLERAGVDVLDARHEHLAGFLSELAAGGGDRRPVAAGGAFRFRGAAELAAPEHDRLIEHSSPLEILDKRGDRLVGPGGHAQVVALDIAVRVPFERAAATAAGDDADEPHSLLDESPGQ